MTEYNEPPAPTLLDYHRDQAQQHYDRARGTTLGAGCCPECGRPVAKCLEVGCWDADEKGE